MSTYERPLRSDELMHYGRKGMKWGQHIFTNPDGSLNAAGRAAVKKGYIKVNKRTGKLEKVSAQERRINKKKKKVAKIQAATKKKLAKQRLNDREKAWDDKLKNSKAKKETLKSSSSKKSVKDNEYRSSATKKGSEIVASILKDSGSVALSKFATAAMMGAGTAIVGAAFNKYNSSKGVQQWDNLTIDSQQMFFNYLKPKK